MRRDDARRPGPGWVVLDDTRHGRASVYSAPARIIVAEEPAQVPATLAAMRAALADGHHLAGYFAYELGYVLEPRLARLLPAKRATPLLWFGVFEHRPAELDAAGAASLWLDQRCHAGPVAWEWNAADFRRRFDAVMAAIRSGNIYQANLSMRGHFHFIGDPRALHGRLRRQAGVAHGAFVDDGQRQILSLSPELFFRIGADGVVVVRPMKGTAPRGADAAGDRIARERLQASPKERAENLMIVDLLRNDLGRIAVNGSVEVPEMFAVESYPTVHQMTSTVRARIPPGCAVDAIVQALFPCGSVTGAPKIRAMEIIRGLEDSPRGAYCGAIGAFAPDGSAHFNVAIRTITLGGNRGELGVGGAVVADSSAEREYAECLLKARFFTDVRRPLALLETMAFANGAWPRRRRHLQRLQASAAALGIPFDATAAASALDGAIVGHGASRLRVRLRLQEDGTLDARACPSPASSEPLKFMVFPRRIRSGDPLNRHKTDWRGVCDEALAWAKARGADEAILLNERGEVAEGTFTNVFVERGGRLATPPLSAGALPGCLRAELIESGRCTEAVLVATDLVEGGVPIYLGNSLRGLVPAEPLPSAPALLPPRPHGAGVGFRKAPPG